MSPAFTSPSDYTRKIAPVPGETGFCIFSTLNLSIFCFPTSPKGMPGDRAPFPALVNLLPSEQHLLSTTIWWDGYLSPRPSCLGFQLTKRQVWGWFRSLCCLVSGGDAVANGQAQPVPLSLVEEGLLFCRQFRGYLPRSPIARITLCASMHVSIRFDPKH